MKRQLRIIGLCLFFLLSISTAMAAKPSIRIIATGGTIAGTASSPTSIRYTPAELNIEDMLKSVPGIHELAEITYEQFSNIASQDATDDFWLRLAQRINVLLADPLLDGIVITHGTDTMEETAYFLNLTVKSHKPVVMVGAIRPSTSLSADGDMNLLNAVAVAASPYSVAKGVMIVMNGRILAARSAMKTHTQQLESFQSPAAGQLGYVLNDGVCFQSENLYVHTLDTEFDVTGMKTLPKVGIVYGYAGIQEEVMIPFLTHDYDGLVYAGVGNGNIHKDLLPLLVEARKKGIQVVRSSRVPTGPTSMEGEIDDCFYQFVASLDLSPHKARILLQLALTRTQDWHQIQKCFKKY